MTSIELIGAVTTALDRNKLLREAEVKALTKIGKTKRADLMRVGLFPKPVKVLNEHQLPGRTNFWTQGEILDFLQVQIDARNRRLSETANNGLNHWLTHFPVSRKGSGGGHHE